MKLFSRRRAVDVVQRLVGQNFVDVDAVSDRLDRRYKTFYGRQFQKLGWKGLPVQKIYYDHS